MSRRAPRGKKQARSPSSVTPPEKPALSTVSGSTGGLPLLFQKRLMKEISMLKSSPLEFVHPDFDNDTLTTFESIITSQFYSISFYLLFSINLFTFIQDVLLY